MVLGKTTTIRHLLGFLNSDNGSCKINGLDCRKKSNVIQKNVGYLQGEINFFDDMKGIEFLKFMADLRGMKDLTRMNELLEFFELDAKGKIKKMSKGMKQKIAIVCAFMHDPDILILDEPTSGLDPLMQNKFVKLILDEKNKGKTILMSSHSFEEVEKTCDKVGIIKEGKLISLETISSLKENARKIYGITFENIDEVESFLKENIDIKTVHENYVEVFVNGNINNLISILSKYSILYINNINQSLEDIFMKYYGGESNV
jgi:ABC-2 type transport system ATP-binding protein